MSMLIVQLFLDVTFLYCGDDGARTRDLVVANHALSQLSYIPGYAAKPLSVRVLGFEPRTSALSELRSSQLSYTRSKPGQQKSQTSKGLALSRPWLLDRASNLLTAVENSLGHEHAAFRCDGETNLSLESAPVG